MALNTNDSAFVLQEGSHWLMLDAAVFDTAPKRMEAMGVFKKVVAAVDCFQNAPSYPISANVDIRTGIISGAMFVGKANLLFSDLAKETANGQLAAKLEEAKGHAIHMEIYSHTLSDIAGLHALRNALLQHYGLFEDVPF